LRFKNTSADKLDWVDWLARQRLGVKQPSAAFLPQDWQCKSGRGLPQSKTSRKFSGALKSSGTV
jgi:hypothetical protein